MNHRQRQTYSLTAIFGLLFLISHVSSAVAQNYTLNSLYSENQGLPQLGGTYSHLLSITLARWLMSAELITPLLLSR